MENIVRNAGNTATLDEYITLRREGKKQAAETRENEQEGPKLIEKRSTQ